MLCFYAVEAIVKAELSCFHVGTGAKKEGCEYRFRRRLFITMKNMFFMVKT